MTPGTDVHTEPVMQQTSSTAPSPDAVPPATAAPVNRKVMPSEYLTFCIGDEEYGIDILCVQEIRSYEQPTRIANAPAHVNGVIDLRGVVVPIIDLRGKLGCQSSDYNAFTVVIVLYVKGDVIGAVVDSVSDVVRLEDDMIRPAPDMDAGSQGGYITGIGTTKVEGKQRMLILLDIETLMSYH